MSPEFLLYSYYDLGGLLRTDRTINLLSSIIADYELLEEYNYRGLKKRLIRMRRTTSRSSSSEGTTSSPEGPSYHLYNPNSSDDRLHSPSTTTEYADHFLNNTNNNNNNSNNNNSQYPLATIAGKKREREDILPHHYIPDNERAMKHATMPFPNYGSNTSNYPPPPQYPYDSYSSNYQFKPLQSYPYSHKLNSGPQQTQQENDNRIPPLHLLDQQKQSINHINNINNITANPNTTGMNFPLSTQEEASVSLLYLSSASSSHPSSTNNNNNNNNNNNPSSSAYDYNNILLNPNSSNNSNNSNNISFHPLVPRSNQRPPQQQQQQQQQQEPLFRLPSLNEQVPYHHNALKLPVLEPRFA